MVLQLPLDQNPGDTIVKWPVFLSYLRHQVVCVFTGIKCELYTTDAVSASAQAVGRKARAVVITDSAWIRSPFNCRSTSNRGRMGVERHRIEVES